MDKNVFENQLIAMAETVMGFTSKGGDVGPAQYHQFWADLSTNPVQVSDYLTSLIVKFVAVSTGEDKSYILADLVRKVVGKEYENASDQARLTSESLDNQQTLLGTIYFISLFFPFDATSDPLKVAIARWLKLRGRGDVVPPKGKAALDSTFVDECLRALAPGYLEANESAFSLIAQCSHIPFPDDFVADSAPIGLLASCLLNTYLRNCLREGRQTRILFDGVLTLLKQSKTMRDAQLLTLLHMLRGFVVVSPKLDPEILENAIEVVKQYYLWPCPYGDVAKELLNLLSVELKSAGSGMRELFVEENPELEKGYVLTGRERIVYIIADQNIEKAKRLRTLLQSFPPEEVSPSQIQMNLLASILETNANIDPDQLHLEFCTREDTATFYHTAMEILNQAVMMSEKEAIAFRHQKLTALKDYIVSRSTATRRSSVALQSSARTSSLPPLQFEFMMINSSTEEPPLNYETHFKYPHRMSMDILLNIIKLHRQPPDNPKPCVIKVGIAGDDQTLHSVAGSYVALKMTKPRLFENLSFQFYIIPLDIEGRSSNFPHFLAKHDGWYGRHVLCLANYLLRVLPSAGAAEPKADGRAKKATWSAIDSPSPSMQLIARSYAGIGPAEVAAALEGGTSVRVPLRPPCPSLLLRAELQNYFREARNRLEVNLYQCECWCVGDTAYFTVPFAQRVTVGIQAFAKAFMTSNNMTERMSVEELQSKVKGFKYAPCALGLKFIQMSVTGAPRQGPPMKYRPYNEIVVANVPARGDRFTPAHPSKNWLEMYTQKADSKKRSARSAKEHTYHISAIEVEPKDRRKDEFHVLIDDVLYGPFTKIKIGPVLSSKEPMACRSLPVMTYFPLDL